MSATEPTLAKVFQKTITLGNLIQIGVILVGGVVGYNKLEWRITQLEQVKLETKNLISENAKEQHDGQVRLSEAISRLDVTVTRLATLEEMRQRQLK